MNKKLLIVIVASYSLLTACVSNPPKNEQNTAMATRVYSHVQCPKVSKPEALTEVLAGLFLAPLIESSIKGLGEAIKKAGEDQVTTRTATTVDHFYDITLGKKAGDETKIGQNIGCITVIYGQTSNATGQAAKEVQKKFEERFKSVHSKLTSYATINNYLSPDDPTSGNLEFSDDVRFFAQYSIQLSEDKTALLLEPKMVLIGGPFAKPKGSSSGKRDIVLVVSFKLPSQGGGDEAFAVLTSNFSAVEDYTVQEGTALLGHSTGWMPMPPVPDNVATRLTANATRRIDLQSFVDLQEDLRTELESDGLTPAKRKELEKDKASAKRSAERLQKLISADQTAVELTAPVTITTSLVETQEGSKFLVNFGSFLSEKNKEISEPILEVIDPSKRKAAKAAEADTEDTLRVAAIEAVADYDTEDAKTGAARDEAKLRIAKIKAKQACRKLKAAGYEDISCLDL